MSIIDRILGRMPGTTPPTNARPDAAPGPITDLPDAAPRPKAAPTPVQTTAEDGPLMRVYDQFGRAVSIGRESWRTEVLLPNLAANRDKPGALYGLVVAALNDGFAADVLESARVLAANDAQPPRGAAVLGAVLLQLGDFTAAREVLERALVKHGDNAYLLASLARAYQESDPQRAQQLIWRALALDPNEETSLGWLIAIANAKGGQPAMLAVYARLAALPGSWRAQLWLARYALESDDLAGATRLYEEALGRAAPVPADLLMQLSGDLGNRGHTALLLQLTRPRFDLEAHGLLVGNNLIRAYIDLGMLAEARALLEQLYSKRRPDWRDTLQYWDQTLDDAEKRYGEVSGPVEIVLLKLEQPVWARGVLGFEEVLPAKNASAARVHFVCASGESAGNSQADGKVVSQPTNELGRIARSLPMFFAEEFFLCTSASSAFLLPWMKQGGFVLSAKPWTRGFLPPDPSPPDVLVFTHIDATQSPWMLRVTIETPARPQDAAGTIEQSFEFRTCANDVRRLLSGLIERVTVLLSLRREEGDPALAAPGRDLLPGYLTAIEQALAVGLAARMSESEFFLHQERAIFDHLFDVALSGAERIRPRMLLVNALENESRRRPDIVREYLEKLALLQQKHPLPAGHGSDLVVKAVQTVTEKANAG
jgi:tetratricopeptide (TPR) repeat protein